MTHVDAVDVEGNVDQMVKKIREATNHFGGYTKQWRYSSYFFELTRTVVQTMLSKNNKNNFPDFQV